MKSPARATTKSPFIYAAFCLYVLLLFDFPIPGISSSSFTSRPLCLPLLFQPFLLLIQGSCAADLYRHPQLDADIEAVKEIYSENSVSIRWDSTSEVAEEQVISIKMLEGFSFYDREGVRGHL